jgi:hypothetical protein
MKVKLKPGWSGTYPELTVGNVYRVLGIEADDLRILNDAGDPVLYHPRAFTYLDPVHPAEWIAERGDGGELYAYPAELGEPRHFFEEFHDGNAQIRSKLCSYLYERSRAERAATPPPPNSYMVIKPRGRDVSEPVTYIELDEDRGEVRKVDVFSDGRVTAASGKGSTGTTRLAELPAPTMSELATSSELVVTEISRAEFEEIWDTALDSDVP